MMNDPTSAWDIAGLTGLGVIAIGFIVLFKSGIFQYKSAHEIPRGKMMGVVAIMWPLIALAAFAQAYHHTIPWLTYVPFPRLYSV
jgi:hypothetical protein